LLCCQIQQVGPLGVKLFEIFIEGSLLEVINFGMAKSLEGLDHKCDESNTKEQLFCHEHFDEENLSLSV